MPCIYADVLLILNIYVTYFLLLAAAKLTHSAFKMSRCITASVTGSLFSLTILLPQLDTLAMLLIKLVSASVIVIVCFGLKEPAHTLRLIAYFFVVNFIFAGIMLGIYFTFKPAFMSVNNMYLYIDFDLAVLVVCTAIAYILICAVRSVMDKSTHAYGNYTVRITLGEKNIKLPAIPDTGNFLSDTISGKPIIICSYESISELVEVPVLTAESDLSSYICCSNIKGIRFLPFSTVSENGVIPVFPADDITITDETGGNSKKVNALIGVNHKTENAIFNPTLLL